MRLINKVCSFLLGYVFFVAGILKLMDPVGAGLVVQEYFALVGLFPPFLLSKSVAVAIALLESLVGSGVITGVWRRQIAWTSAVMMFFFTVLTLVLMLVAAPMDCGCFGEAVHLTHTQSFVKNLLLCVLWAGSFLPFAGHREAPRMRYSSQMIVTLFVLLFALWSMKNVPPMDFTPFAPGTQLYGDQSDEEDGASLSCCTADGEYPDSLLLGGRVLVVSVYDIHNISADVWQSIAELTDEASGYALRPVIIAATTPDDIDGAASDPRLLTNLYFGDRREIMTFNRSNGGVTYLDNGMIVRKWARGDFLDSAALSYISSADASTILVESNSSPRLKVQAFLLFTFAVMLLL